MNAKTPLIFRNRDFSLLWLGQVLSQSGTRMYQIAIVWWILTVAMPGRGGVALGTFLVLGALPSILFVGPIGRLIEKSSLRKILVSADLTAGIVILGVGALLLASSLSFPVILAAGFLVALMQGLVDPTLNKAVPDLVSGEDLEKAVAFQSSTQYLANFGGAVAGAMLFDLIGFTNVIWLNAGSYALAGICSFLIRFPTRKVEATPEAWSGEGEIAQEPNVRKSGAWHILDDYPLIKRILIAFGAINFFGTPMLVILPLYTAKTLKADASILGMLEAALWIGLLAGTFSASMITFVRNTLVLGAVCMFIFGAAMFAPGLIVDQWFYAVMLFIGGLFLGVNNVKFITMFQETIDPDIKGRFFALLQALVSFTFPIAYFLFGVLGDLMPPPHVCMIQGAGVMIVALYFVRLSRWQADGSSQ